MVAPCLPCLTSLGAVLPKGSQSDGSTTKRRRVLIVSHEASRTGAPRVALDATRALEQCGWDVRVVLRWNGPLRSEFEAAASGVDLEPLRHLRAALRLWRPTRPIAALLEQVAAAIQIVRVRPSVVWCNTVLSSCYVRPSVALRRDVVLYAHEPEERIHDVLRRYRLDGLWRSVLLAGCAPRICVELAAATGVAPGLVREVNPVPNVSRIARLAGEALLGELPRRPIVGTVGTADLRKGVDLWLDVVAKVAAQIPDLEPYFVWVGGDRPQFFDHWAETTGLGESVLFTGSLANPYPYLASFDVFTLASRDDPFPLAVLEAMALGLPVVAFDIGDVREQLAGTGRLVPAETPAHMAQAVVELLRDSGDRRSLGAAAADRAKECFSWDAFARSVCAIAARTTAGSHQQSDASPTSRPRSDR